MKLQWWLLSLLAVRTSATASDWTAYLSSYLTQQYAEHLSRQLAIGDFERFNELFAGAELALPDQDLGNGGASLRLTNLYCGDIEIGEILTNYTVFQRDGKDVLSFDIVAYPFAMECYADYEYRLFVIPGDGEARITTSDNRLSTRILIESASTFENEPPMNSTVAFCDTKIETNGRVNFSGDWLGEVIELFKDPVSDLVESEASNAVCDEFQKLGPEMFGNLLNSTKNLIDEWLVEPPPEVADPLYPEKTFRNTDNVDLINFRANSSESIGDLFVSILKQENAIFGSSETDPTTGESDLGINNFLRNSFLDEDGVLRLSTGETDSFFDSSVFAGHNSLLQTNILIEGIALRGLDTLRTFSAFTDIGNYTIANQFTWEKLSLEVNLTIDLKPSTLPNSMIRSSTEIHVNENVTFAMDLTGLDVSLALFMAINEEKLNALKLGSLLNSQNILPCLFSSMVEFEVSGLDVSVADLSVPYITGFVSPGIDRILSDIAEAAFLAYEPTMLRAMPGFFQGPVRDILKNSVLADFINSNGGCPDPAPQTGGPLDFRDLFLAPNESVALGGTGKQPYGDIGSLAYNLIQDKFVGVGSDGLPGINDAVIRPMTEKQSGTPGVLRFPNTIFSLSSYTERRRLENNIFASLGGLNTSIGDVRITNIDSVVPPLELFSITDSPSVLRNDLNMGTSSNGPLTVTVKLMSGPEGMVNEVDISASIESLSLFADMKALMHSSTFLQFPLGDVLNINCWLASLPSVELDSEGFLINPQATRSLSLTNFRSSLSSLALTTDCLSCPSAGLSLLPDLFQILDQSGSVGVLGSRLANLLDSVAMSDTTLTMLDRLIVDGSKSCPSSTSYDPDADSPAYGFVGLPTFSGDSIDTVLFSGVLAAELAFIVFAETERVKGTPETDPLSAQNSFSPPEGIRLIDWTNLGNTTGLGGIADQVIGQVRQYLGGDDENFLDFEAILKGLLDEDGVLVLETGVEFKEGDFLLSLESVRITGFDEFALNDVFEPIAPQTLLTSAQFDELNVEFVLLADAPSTPEPPQSLTVQFSVQDLSFDIALFLAFDLDKIGLLRIGSLLDTKTILGCMMSAAYEFDIPQLKVSVGSFTDPTIEGLMPDTQSAASQVTETIFSQYRAQITEAIPILFDGVVKDTIAGLLDATDESSCKQIESIPTTSFIDFRDLLLPEAESLLRGGSGTAPYGDLLSKAFDFLKRELFVEDGETGLAIINKEFIADLLDSDNPGSLTFPGDLFNEGTRVLAGGLDAFIRLRLYDIYVKNIDTVGVPLTLLDPVYGEAHQLNNSATIGVTKPLQIGARFYFSFVGEDTDIENDIDISVGLDTLDVLLTAFGKMSEKSFMGFPIQDISNLQCWLATIPAPTLDRRGVILQENEEVLSIVSFMAQVAKLGLNISCIDCSGPGLEEFGQLLQEVNESDGLTDFTNGVFEFFNSLVDGRFLQVAIDRALNDARKKCPHSPEYDENFEKYKYEPFEAQNQEDSLTFFIALVVVLVVLIVVSLTVVITTRAIVRRRHRRWVAGLSTRQVNLLLTDQHAEDGKEKQLNDATVSMFRSTEAIPAWVRFSMPLIILVNIGFFLSGHLNLGASVTVMVSFAGQDFSEEGFFEFSMARSTIEIWKAGGRELAILIFLFSFIWPYTKTLITMGLWFAPTNRVSVSRRGSALLWLDALAKWSVIDIFVLVVTIVSFRVSVSSPNVDFLPPEFYSIDLLVDPQWGLYANMIAQIISQVSSHFIIHYHRRIINVAKGDKRPQPGGFPKACTVLIEEEDSESGRSSPSACIAQKPEEEGEDPAEQLHNHAFFRPHRGESDRLVVRKMVNPLLVFVSSVTCVLVVLGCALPSYAIELLGIVGVLVEAGQLFVGAKTDYSVFTTIKLLFEQAGITGDPGDYLGLGTLSILLFLTVLVVPVVQSAVLLVQWFLPLQRKRRYRLSVLLEILQAWQYSEVYLLAIMVGSWQLGPISEFLVNPYCSSINGYLAEAAYYGILKEEDAQCFKADVLVEPTFYILLAGAVLLAIVNTFVMKAVTHYFHDKEGSLVILAFQKAEIAHLDGLDEFETEESADAEADRRSIHPVPVLFTDSFRWLLYREETMRSQQSSRRSVNGADLRGDTSLPSLEQADSQRSWPDDEPVLHCLSAPEQRERGTDGQDNLRCFSAPDGLGSEYINKGEAKEEEIELPHCLSAPEHTEDSIQGNLVSNQSWPMSSNQSDLHDGSVSRRKSNDFTFVDL